MTGAINQLDKSARHTGRLNRLQSRFTKDARGLGMARMTLGDDRVTRRDRCGKVSACDAIVGIGKVVRAKDNDWPHRSEHRTNAGSRVDRRNSPGFCASGSSGLTKLVGRARQLTIFQTRRFGQPRFCMGRFNQEFRAGFNGTGISFQEIGESRSRPASHFSGRFCRHGQDGVNFAPRTDWKQLRQSFCGRGIHCLKSRSALALHPSAIEND